MAAKLGPELRLALLEHDALGGANDMDKQWMKTSFWGNAMYERIIKVCLGVLSNRR